MKLHRNDPWDPLSEYFKDLNFVKNSGFHGNRKKELQKSSYPKSRAFIFGMKHHLVVLYQNTSNYGPGVEICPMLLGLRFHIVIKKEIFKNLLVPNYKG